MKAEAIWYPGRPGRPGAERPREDCRRAGRPVKGHRRRAGIFLSCVLLLGMLTGCRLAREQGETGAERGRLIGVYLTGEHLDLFDFERYIEDQMKASGFTGTLAGGEIPPDGAGAPYQGRIYAELKSETLTGETGEAVTRESYVFPGLDGLAFFSARFPATASQDSYIGMGGDDGVSDRNMRITDSDEENRLTLEGTVYVAGSGGGHTYFFNPVYQSGDGRVYLTAGTGTSVLGDSGGEGMSFSQSLDESSETVENGVVRRESASVSVTVRVMYVPEQIAVYQMDAAHRLLETARYVPGNLPAALDVAGDAAYLVVETHKRDETGAPVIQRQLYDGDDANMESFHARPDGVCVKSETPILWEGKLPELR